MTPSLLAGLLFTYAGAGIAIFLAARRFIGPQRVGDWLLAGLCVGLGPALVSRILTAVYYAFPGRQEGFYVLLTLTPFALLTAYGLASFRSVASLLRQGRDLVTPRAVFGVGAAVGIAIGLGLIVATSWGQTLLRAGYAGYSSQWSATGPWWKQSLTGWGIAAFTIAAGAVALSARLGSVAGARNTLPDIRGALVAAILGGCCLFVLGASFTLALGRPAYENDAVQYLKVATLLYERATLAIYPVMPAVPGDGTWASSSHPLGQYGMLIWSFLMNGSAAPGPAKLVAPAHLVYCVMAMGVLMARWGRVPFLAAALLLVSTPAMFLQTVGLGIDPPRLFLLAITVAWLCAALRSDDWRVFLVAGLVSGLCMNSHSVNGIVTPVVLAAVILGCYEAPWTRRLGMLGLSGVAALLVGGERYVLNLLQFGMPIYDDHALWHLVPALDFLGWRSALNQTTDAWSRLLAGPFMGFGHWYFWGLAFWAGLFGAVILWRRLWADVGLRIALVAAGLILGLLVVYFGFFASSAGYALNYRYPMTAFPFVAMFAGAWLGGLLDSAATRA